MSDYPSAPPPPPDFDELRARRTAVEQARSAAAQALTAASEALDAGKRVDGVAVVAVNAYTASLDGLATRLTELGVPTPADLAQIDAGLTQLFRTSMAADTSARLATLRRLEPAPTALGELLNRIEAGDLPDGSVVGALLALAELADLAAAGELEEADLDRIQRLQDRAAEGLPAELFRLPVAVILRRVRPRAPEPGVAEPEPTSPEPEAVEPAPAEPADEPAEAGPAQRPVLTPEVPAVAEADSADDQPTEEDTGPSEAEVNSTLAALIRDRRFGMAAAITRASGRPDALTRALRIAALADVVSSATGPVTDELRTECADADIDALAGDGVTLNLVVPALVHAALVTGEAATGTVLTRLAPRIEPQLGTIAEQVGQLALNGDLAGGGFRAVLATVEELEEQVRAAASTTQQVPRHKKLRLKPATQIANHWLDDGGLLGKLLVAAGSDQRDRHAEVAAEVNRLSRQGELDKELRGADRFRRESRKLDGRTTQELFAIVKETRTVVAGWVSAVAELQSATTREHVAGAARGRASRYEEARRSGHGRP